MRRRMADDALRRVMAGRAGALSIALASLAAVVPCARAGITTLVPAGADWKYLDDGSNQGTAWRGTEFDDSTWASGPAQLGYGEGDEATVVSYGPNPAAKYITTYFRHSFIVPDASVITNALVRLLRDDGAVVYLNGTEIFRTNLPAGTISYLTLATSTIGGADENAFLDQLVDPQLLVSGTNVLAVEMHQRSGTSSDLSMDLKFLTSTAEPFITRGPYLQTGAPNRVTVQWRTQPASDSIVWYGPAPDQLTQMVTVGTVTTEHSVKVLGLSPATRYYYAVGSSAGVIAGADADHFFTTSPTTGDPVPTRIWVIGDSGTANLNAAAVRDAYLSFASGSTTDVWLLLGDNAYNNGTDTQYQAAVFQLYASILRQTVAWPAIGNHDALSADSPTQTGVYYDIFNLPRAAEAGGLASGTEAYYSFDYGSIHFVCLDSEDTNRLPGGAMMTWLDADLADTLADWVIAYWHHPPYTKGSHDSDNNFDSGGRMRDMRQYALPILEAAGVDLVLAGHSHSYERSYLLDGHYGPSSTLLPEMILDAGDGREDGDGAYVKPTIGMAPHEGAVYAVAGSSGKIGGGFLNHPAMFISLNSLGSLVLDVDGDRLDAVFLDQTGTARDHFTILKGPVPGDLNGDGVVDVLDLLEVIAAWGPCPKPCPPACAADVNADCTVDVLDLLAVLSNWS